jgi:polar amino acid transport system substrate-binding protein
MMKRINGMLIFSLVILAGLVPGCMSPAGPETAGGGDVPVANGTAGDTTGISGATEELMFVTENYPPFNYVENGTIKGIAVDLLTGVYRHTDTTSFSDRIWVYPWSKAFETTLSRNNTVLFATVRLPERENLFKWAGPLGSERKVIFANRERVFEITGPEDLNKYRIGVIKDDAATAQLLSLGIDPSHIVALENVPALI